MAQNFSDSINVTNQVTTKLEEETDLIRQSVMSAKARLQAEKFEEHVIFIELIVLVLFVVGILIWWTLTRLGLKNRYKAMIDWIDNLRKNHQYTGKGDGLQFAFWYHYPHLSVVQLTNINLPAAVMYGYYGSPDSISQDFKDDTSSLQKMFEYSELHGRATSVQILCYWVNAWSNLKETSVCIQYCGVPPIYTNAQATSTVTSMTLGYAMTFNMIVPGVGAVVGAAVGFGMGMWQSQETASWYNQECQFNEQQGCTNPSSLSCGETV